MGEWEISALGQSVDNLALLPHVKELFNGNSSQSFDGNDIQIYSLKDSNGGMKDILHNSNCTFKSSDQSDDPFKFIFRFALYDKGQMGKKGELFWGTPKLILYPLSHIGLVTLPIYHYDEDIELYISFITSSMYLCFIIGSYKYGGKTLPWGKSSTN